MQNGSSRTHRIHIVAPTGEELDRLRQAVELDRELLEVRKQLLALEKERCLFTASTRGMSPRAERPYDRPNCHVDDRSAALSEEHVRSFTAFDEAVLTMRRGYSLEVGAVMYGLPDERCEPSCIGNDGLSLHSHMMVRSGQPEPSHLHRKRHT